LPEVSKQVDEALKALGPEVSGSASAYGEDCVYADGRAEFSMMETDFSVTIKVDDLNNEEELGNWIITVMKTLEQINAPGPVPGRVSFKFEKDEQSQFLNVPIQEYKNLPTGSGGAEVYRAFLP
jgi:hypothetical protein